MCKYVSLIISVTRSGQFLKFEGLLSFFAKLWPYCGNLYAIGQIFIVVNGQVWSHWHQSECMPVLFWLKVVDILTRCLHLFLICLMEGNLILILTTLRPKQKPSFLVSQTFIFHQTTTNQFPRWQDRSFCISFSCSHLFLYISFFLHTLCFHHSNFYSITVPLPTFMRVPFSAHVLYSSRY